MASNSSQVLLLLLAGLLAVAVSIADAGDSAGGSDEYHREHVRMHFFNKGNADLKKGYQILRKLDKQDIIDSGFNPKNPTKVLIHGFNNQVTSDSMQLPKNAYFRVNEGEVNVIIVDWSDLNFAPFYFAGFGNIDGVARRVAEVLDFMAEHRLLDLGRLHIIGHSLGAHVAGVTGEYVTSGRIQRITGLDPARPFINILAKKGHLSADDAILVDVIHTNAGKLGEQAASGHVDFYPNGGKEQPGCDFDYIGSCSHSRSYLLFSETIANPDAFPAWKCTDEWAALHQDCEDSGTLADMGDNVSFSEPGSYFLETGDASPFSLTH